MTVLVPQEPAIEEDELRARVACAARCLGLHIHHLCPHNDPANRGTLFPFHR